MAIQSVRNLLYIVHTTHDSKRPVHQAIQYHWILDGLHIGNSSNKRTCIWKVGLGFRVKVSVRCTYHRILINKTQMQDMSN